MKSKSKKTLDKIFKGNDKKVSFYYEIMKQIKKKNKKYLNRSSIKSLIEMDEEHLAYSFFKKVENQKILTIV